MIEAQGVRVDPEARRVWINDAEVRFPRMEFDLLHVLISNAGAVVSREQLMREVWGATWWTRASAKTIDVHLGWVRRKLGDDARAPRLITTVRGRGLRFELDTRQPADEARDLSAAHRRDLTA
jgi:DNA-binding response OmpR family regulator